MAVADLIKQARLDEALKEAENAVRNDPSAVKHRVLLFQLLCVQGAWERATTQMNVTAQMDGKSLLMVEVCRQATLCERFRAEVFAGKRTPVVMGEPEPWVGWMIEALGMNARGEHAAAAELRSKALEAAPDFPGVINGNRIDFIVDADIRLGPILEVLVQSNYYWVPLSRLKRLRIEKPSDLRDMVWAPASFVWTSGAAQEGFVPTRYPGSEKSPDHAIRLSHKTDWTDIGDGSTFFGTGQRVFATSAGDVALLETSELVLDNEMAAPTPPAPDAGDGKESAGG